ncbi:MAG: hypothetical protein EZS28_048232, partial [Streblomastix strix]
MQAYKAMLQEELQEGIIEEIPKEQVKRWNLTFPAPKPSREWRKILEASLRNKQIQPLQFQMNGVEQVRYLLIPNDWAVTFDLNSAFHHLIVYPPHRAYLAFEVDNHHYPYKAMPFGYSAKTRAVKTQGWTGMMISPLEALKELCQLIKKIAENKNQYIYKIQFYKQQYQQMPHPMCVEQHCNQILKRFQQHTKHDQTTRYIGQVIGRNCRPFTQEQQLSQ